MSNKPGLEVFIVFPAPDDWTECPLFLAMVAPPSKIMQCTMFVKLKLGSLSSDVSVHGYGILTFFKSSVRLRIYVVLFDLLVMGK